MKKICLIVLFVSVFLNMAIIQAQNLTFSKVLLVSSLDTVPLGKVWKVESVFSSAALNINTGTSSSQNAIASILIDGSTVVLKSTWGSSYATSSISCTDLPIWLPEGSTLASGSNTGKISVIEFTVSP